MKNILSFLLMNILIFISCENNNDSGDEDNLPHEYTSEILAHNLPPIMGGCFDLTGSLITFSLPLYEVENIPSNIIMPAKIYRIDKDGNYETIYEFIDDPFYSSSWSGDTFASVFALKPDGIRVNLLQMRSGEIIYSYNKNNGLGDLHVDNKAGLDNLEGIIAITSNHKEGIYAITTPTFTGGDTYSLEQPPIIYEIDSLNQLSSYFEFPKNITFNTNCGYFNKSITLYPSDVLIDIIADNEENVYVSFGYDHKVYKIDGEKNLTTFLDTIFCPTSVACDKNNNLFVVSGPRFQNNGDLTFSSDKPVQVYCFNNNDMPLILLGSLFLRGGCFTDNADSGRYAISDATYNISINELNEIFLEDPFEGQVILIK